MTGGSSSPRRLCEKPDNWTEIVNESLPIATLRLVALGSPRQMPFGDPDWIRFVEQQQKAMPAEEDTVPIVDLALGATGVAGDTQP